MKTYDGHLIIENAEKLSNQKKTDVGAQSSEKFINIEFDSLSVKASFSFVTPLWDNFDKVWEYRWKR